MIYKKNPAVAKKLIFFLSLFFICWIDCEKENFLPLLLDIFPNEIAL
jgi:hypothetical protein